MLRKPSSSARRTIRLVFSQEERSSPSGTPEMAEIVGAERREPRDLGGVEAFRADRHDGHGAPRLDRRALALP
jgi:hypothetical protein